MMVGWRAATSAGEDLGIDDVQRSGAGLDHFEGEFLAPDHPLTTFPQVVLTPHIGGATYDTESNHTRTIAEDLCRLLAGATPRTIVNPEVLAPRGR